MNSFKDAIPITLVVDDESDIRDLIRYHFERENFKVLCKGDGEGVLETAIEENIDLIVLDLMLPGIDGLEVCRLLKNDVRTDQIPIVMLTAKGEESDIIKGLEYGADDYVTKPFSPKILVARAKAVLRRHSAGGISDGEVISIGELYIHPGRREVKVSNDLVDLTFSEFEILHLLAHRQGWVFTRNQIIDAVHGDDYPVTDRSVDYQIVGLRKKLGITGKFIKTVRGVGYRFLSGD